MIIVVALAFGLIPGGAAAKPAGPGPVGPAGVSGNGLCTTAHLSPQVGGTLSVEGGPLAPSAAASVNLTVSFYEQVTENYTVNQTLISQNCEPATLTVTTDGSGGFSGTILAYSQVCAPAQPQGIECTVTTAPYAPLTVASVTTPRGYALNASGNGTAFALAWVSDLANVSTSPAGPVVAVAPGATVSLTATPRTGNGSVSPLAPSFDWTVSGAGWSFVAPPTNDSVVLAPGPGNATVSVNASAEVGGVPYTTPSAVVTLSPLPTTLRAGSVDRTALDDGEPLGISLTGTGPPAYAYTASVDPETGVSSMASNCTTAPASPTTVIVRCSVTAVFSVVGSLTIMAELSNGYSNVSWRSPELTVTTAPVLSVLPRAPVGYVGNPLSLSLTATNGTGDPPYGLACFAPGGPGESSCSTAAGPTWTFHPTYGDVGSFSGVAWAVDATDTNRSVPVPVTIVDPPALGPLLGPSAPLVAGTPTVLTVALRGGALPARFWWNASGDPAPLGSGNLSADGNTTFVFSPREAGTITVSFTVRDALGGVVDRAQSFSVVPGPAASISPAGSVPVGPSPVGTSVPLDWQALDAVGNTVTSFSASVDLVVERENGSAAPAWANLTGLGALSLTPVGSFAVPASAWSNGVLAVRLTPAVAGDLTVRLEGSGLPGGSTSIALAVNPDLDHLRLFAPRVALAGTGTNHTLWQISDRFGDAVPGTFVTLLYEGPGVNVVTLTPVASAASGGTEVWVNYSLPASSTGRVELLDPAGDVLFGPVSLAPPAGAAGPYADLSLTTLALPFALAVGLGSASLSATLARRPGDRPRPPDEEEEARRLAEGRALVLEAVANAGVLDEATIAGWFGAEALPADLDDWIASLVTDGSLIVHPRADGLPAYSVAPSPEAEARVTVDPEALERAVRSLEAAVREDPPSDTP